METTIPPASSPVADGRPSRSPLVTGAVAVAIVALGGALGALGGWLWYRWWGPPNVGRVYDTPDGRTWVDLTERGLAQVFAATGQYVVVGLALGLLLGVLAAVLGRHRALVALGAVLVASALAAYVASRVGIALGPTDPQTLVDDVELGERLPAAITLSGWTPYLMWPIGALVGFAGTGLGLTALEEVRRREADPATWLERRPPGTAG